jgi:hypothetical protein
MISAGQARALGLEIHEMKAKIGVATGDQIGFKVAGPAHVRLGGVELEHVAFLIAPDDAESTPLKVAYVAASRKTRL